MGSGGGSSPTPAPAPAPILVEDAGGSTLSGKGGATKKRRKGAAPIVLGGLGTAQNQTSDNNLVVGIKSLLGQ
jgi:hypothetical protein